MATHTTFAKFAQILMQIWQNDYQIIEFDICKHLREWQMSLLQMLQVFASFASFGEKLGCFTYCICST
jgi:hypothetical protein